MSAPIDWDVIAPPPYQPTPEQEAAARRQFERESLEDYVRRLYQEQN